MAKSDTPMMQQYYKIKAEYPDAFLFYRVGDFCELFEEDAVRGAQILELTLTHRNKNVENPVPMAGVPHHAVQSYIDTLVEKGYKVAISEQLEDPKLAEGMVKRDVVQLITPGTIMDQRGAQAKANNYLTSVITTKHGFGLSYADLATGEVYATDLPDYEAVTNELLSLQTKEVVWSGSLTEKEMAHLKQANIVVSKPIETDEQQSEVSFVSQSLKQEAQIKATNQLIEYLLATQKRSLAHLQIAKSYQTSNYLQMSHTAKQNLELIRSNKTQKKSGSLFWLLDQTKTAMGGRLLKQWIDRPLISQKEIETRQQLVCALKNDYFTSANISDALSGVYDLERLTGRVAFGSVNGRELLQLARSIQQVPEILAALKKANDPVLQDFGAKIDPQTQIAEMISTALVDDPPVSIKDGGVIRRGYHEQLDRYYSAMTNGKQWLLELTTKEREATGISTLKIGFNKVFGYYIEVTNSNKDLVPTDRYERKQTLTNAERYITPELKEQESLILEAEAKSTELEYQLFVELREKIKKFIPQLQELARQISTLDVLVSFANLAEKNNYVQPEFVPEQNAIEVINGRHPVVEKVLFDADYIPNDVVMNEETEIFLITGPNMSGKSTYMRQLALIVVMAQIGSFVPADSAKLPIFDQIFTRIGAADDLISGQSTFMVEMDEANQALMHATKNSLILFDEIGRGTATYDGMALAGAIIKYLHDHVHAKTLFATHYHELTDLEETLPGLKNVHVGATKKDGKLIFLHKVLPGPADQSYGIHVAKLAGLPARVIKDASVMLKQLEKENITQINPKAAQLDLFVEDPIDESVKDVADQIKTLYLADKSPLEIMNLVNQWQQELTDEG